jgi:biotin synthase-related radical SAM superfamily protein
MGTARLPVAEQAEHFQLSPDYVRISTAAALVLGLERGRFLRDAATRCINLLQNYPEGCWANCSYCGLARERPGMAEENSFIRVGWPLHLTDLVAEKIAEHQETIGRVCIAQVHDKRANEDLVDMTRRVRAKSDVLISALVTATLLDRGWLARIQKAGADIIGIGLDGASAEVFHDCRGRGTKGPHDWEYHWDIVEAAREMYGPYRVNCHIVVGLGETDRDLVGLFHNLKAKQVAGYLFSFNPEPGTAMADKPRAPLHRWRRIQLVKHLIEEQGLKTDAVGFDADGSMVRLSAADDQVDEAIANGTPFMTDGCPDTEGEVACNRPYGSYRPGEDFRDYPFLPILDDTVRIRHELRLEEIHG